MNEVINVYAPATIANVNVGFDILGLAISPIDGEKFGDQVSVETAEKFTLEVVGHYSKFLPVELEKNIVYKAWELFCKTINKSIPVKMTLKKNMPIGSGLGSSACSIVASIVALNTYAGFPLTSEQSLILMGQLEGEISGGIHYDNVAPCFLGGMQLIVENENEITQSLPVFENWYWVVAYSGINVPTADARNILPKNYARKDCITYGRNLSGFIRGLYLQDEMLATKFMHDIIAEPYRKQLLSKFDECKAYLLEHGALSVGISGSGPTLFAISNDLSKAEHYAEFLQQNYIQNEEGFVKVCKTNLNGTKAS